MKSFTLWDEPSRDALWAVLKPWREHAEAGKPLTVSVRIHEDQRSLEQNKRYWSILEAISQMGWTNGHNFSREAWHHFMRLQFLPVIDGPMGTVIPSSTTKLTVGEMSDYMTQVESWAAEHLQMDFSEVR